MNDILSTILIKNKNLDYLLKESARAKRVRITINREGAVIVTKPKRVNLDIVEKFLISKSDWVFEKVELVKKNKSINISNIKNTKREYLENKDKALKLAKERLNYFNNIYNFSWNNITIKNQKTRWGSCSRKGNLNFNYKLALIPKEMSDYVVVHELCHLKEMNHSKRFWDLVAKAIPDYLEIRKRMKGNLF
ncbi:MAG: M48 family metallopeptidase [Candidatus Pacebacteria bacterium]|nr:M48 family metallopeptidase [Candidatus Paceibacterota bacterium]